MAAEISGVTAQMVPERGLQSIGVCTSGNDIHDSLDAEAFPLGDESPEQESDGEFGADAELRQIMNDVDGSSNSGESVDYDSGNAVGIQDDTSTCASMSQRRVEYANIPQCRVRRGPILDILALLGAGTCLLIDGAALFRAVTKDPLIDWKHGGQMLHLVYRAEKLLTALVERGAVIQIFCFDEEAQFLAPRSDKYLAWVSLYQHLQRFCSVCDGQVQQKEQCPQRTTPKRPAEEAFEKKKQVQIKKLSGLWHDADNMRQLIAELRPRCVLTDYCRTPRSTAFILHLRSLAQTVVDLPTLDVDSPRVLGHLLEETRAQALMEAAASFLDYCRRLERPPAVEAATPSVLAAVQAHASAGALSPRAVVGLAAIGELRWAGGSGARLCAAVYCIMLAFSELVPVRARIARNHELAAKPSMEAERGMADLRRVLAGALQAYEGASCGAAMPDARLADVFDGRLFHLVAGLCLAGLSSPQGGSGHQPFQGSLDPSCVSDKKPKRRPAEHSVSVVGVTEKSELVDLCKRVTDPPPSGSSSSSCPAVLAAATTTSKAAGQCWRSFFAKGVADLAEDFWRRSQLPSSQDAAEAEELGDALQGLLRGVEGGGDQPAYATWPSWGQGAAVEVTQQVDGVAGAEVLRSVATPTSPSGGSMPRPTVFSAESLIHELLEEGEANPDHVRLNSFEPQHFHGLNALEEDAEGVLPKRQYRIETQFQLEEMLQVLHTSGQVQLNPRAKYSEKMSRGLRQRGVAFHLQSFTDPHSSAVPVMSKVELQRLVSPSPSFPLILEFVMVSSLEADLKRAQKGAAREMKFMESILQGTPVSPMAISTLWDAAVISERARAALDHLNSMAPAKGGEGETSAVKSIRAKVSSKAREKPASKADQIKQRAVAERVAKSSKQHLQVVAEAESRWRALGAKDIQGRLLEFQLLLGRVKEYWSAESKEASLVAGKLALKVAQDLDERSPVENSKRKQTFQAVQSVFRAIGGPTSLADCGDVGQDLLRSAAKAMKKLRFPRLEAEFEAAIAPAAASPGKKSSRSKERGLAAAAGADVASSAADGTTCPVVFQLVSAPEHLARPQGQPDSRVQGFDPDDWQRTLLDVADARQSALVLAPTASGKTFISFYVMECVLRTDNEGVVVYVCPTKALANQTYAEVQARYSKTYRSEGKVVAGIFTRDYREHVSSCQILVTVPQCFLILLLSPTLESDEWCRRLRYAILDEVHTLGNAEQGTIWEQVLLVANCPILALSATLGAPETFAAWLHGLEHSRGRELYVVQHYGRYNHLAPSVFDGSVLKRIHPYLALLGGATGDLLPRPPALRMLPEDAVHLHSLLVELEGPTPSLMALAPGTFFATHPAAGWNLSMAQANEWESAVAAHFDGLPSERRLEVVVRLTGEAQKGFSIVEQALEQVGEKTYLANSIADLLKTSQLLPAICFHNSRQGCESIAEALFLKYVEREKKHRQDNRMDDDKKELQEKFAAATQRLKRISSTIRDPEVIERTAAECEGLRLAIAFHDEPLLEFTAFVPGQPRVTQDSVREELSSLRCSTDGRLWQLLFRGIGVHHAGLPKEYRQTVERMFRMRQLGLVVSTSTLAVGINMPSKASIFAGDSVHLGVYQYQQEAGRAGRRGFDLRGHTVFLGLPQRKVALLLAADLPMIQGNEVLTPSLVLRLIMKERFLAAALRDRADVLKAIELVIGSPMFLPHGDASKLQRAAIFRLCCLLFRKQRLLGSRLELTDLAGFVVHIHYDEPGNFALASLLQVPSLLETICSSSREDLINLLCHLFCRRGGLQGSATSRLATTLPPLQAEVGNKITELSEWVLKASVVFWRAFLVTHASSYAIEVLPLTRLQVRTLTPEYIEGVAAEATRKCMPPVILRSAFDALSGWCDKDFRCIDELCRSVRCDLSLPLSAFPAFNSLAPDLNSYLLDFYKHGQLSAIIHKNRIPHTEVYDCLDNFKFMLKALAATAERRAKAKVNRPTSFSDQLVVSAFSAVCKEFDAIMVRSLANR